MIGKFTAAELAWARAKKPTAIADFIFDEMTTFYMRKKCTIVVKNHKGSRDSLLVLISFRI